MFYVCSGLQRASFFWRREKFGDQFEQNYSMGLRRFFNDEKTYFLRNVFNNLIFSSSVLPFFPKSFLFSIV